MTLVDYFLPSAGQIINLFAVLAILAVFAVLGGADSVQGRFAAADVFVGWGVAVPCVFLLWRRNHSDFTAPAAIDVLWRVGLLAYIRTYGRIVPNFYTQNKNCIILKHLSLAKGPILHLPYDAYPIDLNKINMPHKEPARFLSLTYRYGMSVCHVSLPIGRLWPRPELQTEARSGVPKMRGSMR
jgi:hypothetical protein